MNFKLLPLVVRHTRRLVGIFCIAIFSILNTSLSYASESYHDIDFTRLVRGVEFQVVKKSKMSYVPVTDLESVRLWGGKTLKQELDTLSTTLNVKKGTRISKNDVVLDIHQLFVSGHFSLVDVTWEADGNNHMIITFFLQLNPIISDILLQENLVLDNGMLQSMIQSKKGQVLNMKGIQEDRMLVDSWYKSQGYVLSKILSIDVNANHELVFMVSDPIVNDITLEGLDTLRPHDFIVFREFELKKHGVFNSLTMRRDRERLLQLGYFSEVSAPAFTESLDKERVNVSYALNERKINLINLGLEQEDERFVSFIRGDLNHLILPSDVLSGKMQVGYENETVDLVSYSFRYHQPWFLNQVPVSFSWDAWTEFKNQILTRDLQSGANEVIRNKRVGTDLIFKFPLIKNRLSLSTKGLIEDVSPYDETLTVGDDGYFAPYKLRSVSFGLSFSSLTKFHNPTDGMYWNLQYEKGGDLWGIDVGGLNFYRVKGEIAGFYDILPKTTMGIRLLGGIFAPFSTSGNEDVLTFEQEEFSIGGASSLRGYKEYFKVNEKIVLLNIEFRKTLSQEFQTVIFWDMGTAFANYTTLEALPIFSGAGLGLRYFTPLGPIRLDFAYGDAFLIQFGIGQVF